MFYTIIDVLNKNYNHCNYQYSGVAYKDIIWTDNLPQPLHEELNAQLQILQDNEALRLLREKRNSILKSTDHYMFFDFPHPNEQTKQSWVTYRQQLRDLPSNSLPILDMFGELDQSSVQWPLPPT